MIAKKTQLKKYPIKPKSNEECFNYRKKGHYTRNYHYDTENSNKKAPKVIKKS